MFFCQHGFFAADDRIGIEAFAEVHFLGGFVFQNGFGVARDKHLTGADHVSAIGNGERFPFAVVGEQNGDTGVAQFADNVLDAVDRDRVDPGEWFVEQNERRFTGQAASDF